MPIGGAAALHVLGKYTAPKVDLPAPRDYQPIPDPDRDPLRDMATTFSPDATFIGARYFKDIPKSWNEDPRNQAQIGIPTDDPSQPTLARPIEDPNLRQDDNLTAQDYAERDQNRRVNGNLIDAAQYAMSPGLMAADALDLPEDSGARLAMSLPGPGEIAGAAGHVLAGAAAHAAAGGSLLGAAVGATHRYDANLARALAHPEEYILAPNPLLKDRVTSAISNMYNIGDRYGTTHLAPTDPANRIGLDKFGKPNRTYAPVNVFTDKTMVQEHGSVTPKVLLDGDHRYMTAEALDTKIPSNNFLTAVDEDLGGGPRLNNLAMTPVKDFRGQAATGIYLPVRDVEGGKYTSEDGHHLGRVMQSFAGAKIPLETSIMDMTDAGALSSAEGAFLRPEDRGEVPWLRRVMQAAREAGANMRSIPQIAEASANHPDPVVNYIGRQIQQNPKLLTLDEGAPLFPAVMNDITHPDMKNKLDWTTMNKGLNEQLAAQGFRPGYSYPPHAFSDLGQYVRK